MKTLTLKQEQILKFISQFTLKHHYAPTVRELADHLGISTKAAYDHLTALHKKEAILWEKGHSRSILVRKPFPTHHLITLPLVPFNQLERYLHHLQTEQTLTLSSSLFQLDNNPFALQLNENPLLHFLKDDLLICSQHPPITDNTLVLVQLNQEYQLKYFFNELNRIRLQDDTSNPLYALQSNVIAVVVGLIRSARPTAGGGLY